MFSPQPATGEALLNPAARRRGRPSRPVSRVQQRNERASTTTSVDSTKESSPSDSQRQESEGPGAGDISIIRRPASLSGAKEPEGGSVDLTKNDRYRVSRLPGMPSIFSQAATDKTPVIAYADSTHRYALLLNHTAAYVWEYAVPHALPLTFSFPLPREGPEDANSPFPLGCLVSPSANSQEPGLVVVMPLTGRIAYWDAVSSAVSEGLFAKRRGVEGKVATMSGEIITSICSAEPAGFVISTSSGRLAHLALRDAAGRPGIFITMMRGSTGLGGLLGALRAGSNRRDIVAVRAGRVIRIGEREVFVATARGNFSRWGINRTGGYTNTTDVDLREQILYSLSEEELLRGRNKDHFAVVDLQVTGYSQSDYSEQEYNAHLLVLCAITTPGSTTVYIVVALKLHTNGKADVADFHVIKSYMEGWNQESAQASPRIYLPAPQKTAFVVFSKAVVVMSKINGNEAEDIKDGWYEDVVDFRGDLSIEIVGSGQEFVEKDTTPAGSFTGDQGHVKKIKNPGVILLAKGAGILRVEAFDAGSSAKPVTAPVTAKSKLEQAIYYGTRSENPLNFLGRSEVKFPIHEVEDAALEISQEILNSNTKYLPKQLPSLGGHLDLRALHLRALVQHLRTGAFGHASKEILWQLLQDAEKLEAAKAVWAVHNQLLQEYPNAGEGALGQVINQFLMPAQTSNDPVRQWFLTDVVNIDKLLRYTKKTFASMPDKGRKQKLQIGIVDSEANEMLIGGLMKAWAFRVDNAELYNLSGPNGINLNGLLVKSDGFPAPWTSEPLLLQALSNSRDLSEATLEALWEPTNDAKQTEVVEKIAKQLMHLAECCCRAFEERSNWCVQQTKLGDEVRIEGQAVRERYVGCRGDWIKPLVKYGLSEEAFGIAEDYESYRTLVEMCSEKMHEADAELIALGPSNQEGEAATKLKETKLKLQQRLEGYFEKFGEQFAFEMYDYLVENNQLHTLLTGFEAWREQFLTPYLRKNPKYSKLSWMHDISLGQFNTAADTLYTIATKKEEILAHQRIELSIGKLSKLAALERAGIQQDAVDLEMENYNIKLEIIKAQQKIRTAVDNVVRNAIDVEAAVQLATEEYGKRLKKLPALRALFQKLFKDLVLGKALAPMDLVELITLMESSDEDFLEGTQYYVALQVMGYAATTVAQTKIAEKTIWRRCFLRDDWTSIVSTHGKSDEAVTSLAEQSFAFRTLFLCYSRGYFAPDSPFAPIGPEEALASEEGGEEILIRFPKATQEEAEALAKDLYEENKRLKRHITSANLASWYQDLKQQIKAATEGQEGQMSDEDVEMGA